MDSSRNASFDANLAACFYGYMAWTCTYALLSPIFLYVISVGFQPCRNSSSSNSTHSDVFTFHMAAVEMVGVATACSYMVYFLRPQFALGGVVTEVLQSLTYMVSIGQTLLHILVCLERYLAVGRPILYLRLKKRGVAIRNVSIALVWLFSLGMSLLYYFVEHVFIILLITTVVLSLVLIMFLCASVLWVLIRPGPGERGGDRRHIDRAKRKAFHTMASISLALMLKFGILFIVYMVFLSEPQEQCALAMMAEWFSLPSSLVMPTLFLYRRLKPRKANPQ